MHCTARCLDRHLIAAEKSAPSDSALQATWMQLVLLAAVQRDLSSTEHATCQTVAASRKSVQCWLASCPIVCGQTEGDWARAPALQLGFVSTERDQYQMIAAPMDSSHCWFVTCKIDCGKIEGGAVRMIAAPRDSKQCWLVTC